MVPHDSKSDLPLVNCSLLRVSRDEWRFHQHSRLGKLSLNLNKVVTGIPMHYYGNLSGGFLESPRFQPLLGGWRVLECEGKHILWISRPINEQDSTTSSTMAGFHKEKMTSSYLRPCHAAHFKPFFFGSFRALHSVVQVIFFPSS